MACFSSFVPSPSFAVHGSNGVSVVIVTAKGAKTANKKGSVPCSSEAVQGRVQGEFPLPSREGTESREGRRGPCSYRSCCSRFMVLKLSVPSFFNRETREIREKLYGLFLLVRTLRVVRGSCFSTGVSVVIFTAKHAKSFYACFSLFIPFPLFAVHGSKTECPLFF